MRRTFGLAVNVDPPAEPTYAERVAVRFRTIELTVGQKKVCFDFVLVKAC